MSRRRAAKVVFVFAKPLAHGPSSAQHAGEESSMKSPMKKPVSATNPLLLPPTKAPSKIRFEVILVTPQMAEQWLTRNIDNRDISQPRVEAFARVMRNGGWEVNSQAIAFDSNGRLVDGQHRLWAIITAGVAVYVSVAFDMDANVDHTLDRGAVRTVAEVLRRAGKIPEPRRVAMWCNSERKMLTNSTSKGGVEDAQAYYESNKDSVDFVLKSLPTKKHFKAAMIGASLVFAHRKFPQVVERVIPRLVDGAGLDHNSPVLAIRETIMSAVGEYQNRPLALRILRGLQAEMRGEKIEKQHLYATESALTFFQK